MHFGTKTSSRTTSNRALLPIAAHDTRHVTVACCTPHVADALRSAALNSLRALHDVHAVPRCLVISCVPSTRCDTHFKLQCLHRLSCRTYCRCFASARGRVRRCTGSSQYYVASGITLPGAATTKTPALTTTTSSTTKAPTASPASSSSSVTLCKVGVATDGSKCPKDTSKGACPAGCTVTSSKGDDGASAPTEATTAAKISGSAAQLGHLCGVYMVLATALVL